MANENLKTHKDLEVWQKSIELVSCIYIISNGFPSEERYGLISQVRRSAISIPSNIAEGAGRRGVKEFIQFLYISIGSLCELETQIIISQKIGYLSDPKEILSNIETVRKLIFGLINALKKR